MAGLSVPLAPFILSAKGVPAKRMEMWWWWGGGKLGGYRYETSKLRLKCWSECGGLQIAMRSRLSTFYLLFYEFFVDFLFFSLEGGKLQGRSISYHTISIAWWLLITYIIRSTTNSNHQLYTSFPNSNHQLCTSFPQTIISCGPAFHPHVTKAHISTCRSS